MDLQGDQTLDQEPRTDFGGTEDRRENSRFPLREEVKYKMLHPRSRPMSGAGKTLNIGSGGILFTTEQQLPVGFTVELSVDWPAMLDGTCALKFVAVGQVIRSEQRRAAVRIDKYQFKTRGVLARAAGG